MTTADLMLAWLKVLAVWAAIAAFFGAVIGVGIVVARGVIALLGGG